MKQLLNILFSYMCINIFFAEILVKFVILSADVVKTWSFLDRKLGKATAAIILSLPLMPTHKLPSLYTTKPLKSFTMVCQCKLSIRHTLSIPFSLLINNTLQTQPLPVDQRAASCIALFIVCCWQILAAGQLSAVRDSAFQTRCLPTVLSALSLRQLIRVGRWGGNTSASCDLLCFCRLYRG